MPSTIWEYKNSDGCCAKNNIPLSRETDDPCDLKINYCENASDEYIFDKWK